MNIKEYKREKGLTNQELADKLKVSKAYVSMISTGRRVPSRKLQVAIDEMMLEGLKPRDDIGITVTAERTGDREITIKITL